MESHLGPPRRRRVCASSKDTPRSAIFFPPSRMSWSFKRLLRNRQRQTPVPPRKRSRGLRAADRNLFHSNGVPLESPAPYEKTLTLGKHRAPHGITFFGARGDAGFRPRLRDARYAVRVCPSRARVFASMRLPPTRAVRGAHILPSGAASSFSVLEAASPPR